MDAAVTLRMTAVRTEPPGWVFPRLAMASRVDQPGPAAADPTAWPVLWARCWTRIRTWRVPPRWSFRDWCDEARAQGEAAACGARRDFNPHRLVPLDAFLYSRVVDAVWTRYRQECSFGRRTRPGEAIPDRPAPERPGLDADTLARLEAALGSLAELDRGLIHQLFWDGRCEDDLARERGVSQQAVSKRKQKILKELRRHVGMP
ncbi:MAG: hypothetical protein ACLP53_03585 [Isosphaeraceae bacterium]